MDEVATRYSQLEYSDERFIAAFKRGADKLLSDKANGLQTLNY